MENAMNINYEQQGDYIIPCIKVKEQSELHLGVWAERHRKFLRENHRVRYYNLLTSEKLDDYLADVEEQAENLFSWLVKQLSAKEGITEKLKAEDMMTWVRRMNSVRGSCSE